MFKSLARPIHEFKKLRHCQLVPSCMTSGTISLISFTLYMMIDSPVFIFSFQMLVVLQPQSMINKTCRCHGGLLFLYIFCCQKKNTALATIFQYSAPHTGRLRRRDSDGLKQGPILVAPPVRPMCLRLKSTLQKFQLIPAFPG